MEKFGVPEPQWILDRTESGPLVWRRDQAGNNSRYLPALKWGTGRMQYGTRNSI